MKKAGLYLQAGFYVLAGINHFWHPVFYKQIMPPWLPWHYPIIYFSGFCEIALGLLFLPGRTRKTAAWLIILLLIAIFPANIQMMLNSLQHHRPDSCWTIIRLPIQFLLIGWAYFYTKDLKPIPAAGR
jgi:uncharacterized membrane protein